jgi:hypothetical protein
MKSFASYLFQISGCAALTSILAASAQAAGLEGTVTYGASGIPAAQVSVYQTGTQRKSVTLTNSVGAYAFRNLPSGSYIILVEKDGRRIYQGRVAVPERVHQFNIRL